MDFSLKSSELKEMFRIHNLRKHQVNISDLKLLKSSNKKQVLIRTNTGFVYLVNYSKNQRESVCVNEVLFGKEGTTAYHEQLTMEEKNLLFLPNLSPKEHLISIGVAEDALGKTLILVGSNIGKVYLLSYDDKTKTTVYLSSVEMVARDFVKKEDSYDWIAVGNNGVEHFTIKAADNSINLTNQEMFRNIDKITGCRFLNKRMYFWEHGVLYDNNGSPIYEGEKLIIDLFEVENCLMVLLINGSLCLIKPNSVNPEEWSFNQTVKLGGTSMTGAAVSLNESIFLTLTQKSIFEDLSEFSIFHVRGLHNQQEPLLEIDNSNPAMNAAETLFWSLAKFTLHKGDYSDLESAMACTNTLELVKNMLEKAIFGEEKQKNNTDQHSEFLDQILQKCRFSSQTEVKIAICQFLLCLKPSKALSDQLKTRILFALLRKNNSDINLIKNLKEGGLFECPLCQVKGLHISVPSMTGDCESCKESLALTVSQGQIQFVLERRVICPSCFIYHSTDSQKCLMCYQNLTSIDELAHKLWNEPSLLKA